MPAGSSEGLPAGVHWYDPSTHELVQVGPAVPGRVDAEPLECPLVTVAQRAGERGALGAAWERGAQVVLEVS